MQQILLRPQDADTVPVQMPRLAVVVPIFRHSVLLAEAIESVLAQRADFPIQLVLVNDGCPHRETDLVCREYALSYPDRITYLRKPNGGLSDARNHGIRHALATWASVEAIYMLDADNRLRPDAMANAMAALAQHPDAGWIYPNIDMFGL
ncbi:MULTISPECIES: glycosyltransferase family A protein, partial [Paracoccus]